jgi:UDP-N-acetylglucosamine 2-epimerase
VLRIVTVVGARPQFIKAAPLSRALRRAGHHELLVHTGQHYDEHLSKRFFDELGLPAPDVNLNVGPDSPGRQTGRMLGDLEELIARERPHAVILFGDTSSTGAGALAAALTRVPIAHVEAGLRSFNRAMPEEVNRVVTDHLAHLRWAPSATAVENLRAEGITRGVELVGDIMVDALRDSAARASNDVLGRFSLVEKRYLLATLHRASNTEPATLTAILDGLDRLREPVLLPLHPRTRAALASLGARTPSAHVRIVDPVGHLEMVALTRGARLVLTDSGGLQKEAYWLGTPCITLREETEWVETVQAGWNTLVGADPDRLVRAVEGFAPAGERPPLYGDGETARRCVTSLERAFDGKGAGG